MRKLTLSCFIIFTALAQSSVADPLSDSLSVRPAGWFPALQSLAVPGLGQATQGAWLRGGAYCAAEAILLGNISYYWEGQYDLPYWDDAGRTFNREIAYGLGVWYGLGAIYCAADAYYSRTGTRTTTPTLAAFQSVLFPGWGQLANGQYWKGAGMFVLQTGLAYSVYYQHSNYRYYDRIGEQDRANFYRDDRNRLIWWSVGAVLFSAIDAFVDCHLRDWDVSDDLSFAPVYFPESHTVGMGIQIPLNIIKY